MKVRIIDRVKKILAVCARENVGVRGMLEKEGLIRPPINPVTALGEKNIIIEGAVAGVGKLRRRGE